MESLEGENISNIPSQLVELDEDFMNELETETVSFTRQDGMFNQEVTLTYVSNSMEVLNEKLEQPKYDEKKDVVKNEYEGGFTIWECTYDLINFLLQNGEKLDLNGKNILDLGCGHGLVGIFCMKAYDVNTVCFQDFNLDVLKFTTVPNIVKNGFEQKLSQCRFISGDWGDMIAKIQQGTNEIVTPLHNEETQLPTKFNAILMAEVLYNSENYVKLGQIINELLDKDGVCIISSKLYYFGIGGSVDEFKDFMEQTYPHLKIETLQEINDKRSNKREIFCIGHAN